MKANVLSIAALLGVGLLTATAAEKKVAAGPKGGRILEKTSPKAEFFVEKDRSVTIAFYDANLKPVAVADQSATVIADAKDGKAKIEFVRKGDALVSKTHLPEGDDYNVVIQLKQTADARPQNYRFTLDLSTCGGCKLAEYACTCHE